MKGNLCYCQILDILIIYQVLCLANVEYETFPLKAENKFLPDFKAIPADQKECSEVNVS